MSDLLGPNFLQFLLLALAGALVVGNAMALVRPPPGRANRGRPAGPNRDGERVTGSGTGTGADSDLVRAPLWRTVMMLVVGLIVVIWILVSLAS